MLRQSVLLFRAESQSSVPCTGKPEAVWKHHLPELGADSRLSGQLRGRDRGGMAPAAPRSPGLSLPGKL